MQRYETYPVLLPLPTISTCYAHVLLCGFWRISNHYSAFFYVNYMS